MARKKKINVSEKRIQLEMVGETGGLIIKSVENEEIKTENLSEVLDRIVSEGTVVNIRIAEFKPKKEIESKPKNVFKYDCGCNTFNSKKNGDLKLICALCNNKYEVTYGEGEE